MTGYLICVRKNGRNRCCWVKSTLPPRWSAPFSFGHILTRKVYRTPIKTTFSVPTSIILHKFASDSPAQGWVSQCIDFRSSYCVLRSWTLWHGGRKDVSNVIFDFQNFATFGTLEDFATRRPRGCIIPVCLSASIGWQHTAFIIPSAWAG